MPLLRPPIVIEDDVWLAADSFVGPNVTIGEGAVLGARSVAMKNLDPWTIYSGNPAVIIRTRDKLK
jgi:putative colanic acid biosynthesis acetyltransferase WcaF